MVLHRPSETVFADRDCSSASPAALYGWGPVPECLRRKPMTDSVRGAKVA